jgi:hypothetical protein
MTSPITARPDGSLWDLTTTAARIRTLLEDEPVLRPLVPELTSVALGVVRVILCESEPLARRELADFGERCAAAVLPATAAMDGLRRAVRAAIDLEVDARAALPGMEPVPSAAVALRAWTVCDDALVALAEGHRRAERRLGEETDARAELVRGLVLGRLPAGELAAVARTLGLDPHRQYRPVCARPGPDQPTHHVERALRVGGGRSVTAAHGGDVVGLVERRPSLDPPAIAGIGPAAVLHELPSAFSRARRALDTAVAYGLRGMSGLEDLPLQSAVVADPDLGRHLIERCLAPLAACGMDPETLEGTLQALFATEMRTASAARQLGVHVNTMRYRVRRFEQVTGLRLQRPEDAFQVWWALERRRVDAESRG